MDEFEALALAAAARKKRTTGGTKSRVLSALTPEQGPLSGQIARARNLASPSPQPMTEPEAMSLPSSRRNDGMADAALRGAAQGATLGGADEVIAALLAADPNMTYDRALQTVRANNARAQEGNPGSYLAGNIAGGLAAMAPLGAPATIKGGAMLGSAVGVVQGFLSGQGGATSRLASGGIGAAIGGVIGGAIPAIGQAVGAGVRNVGDWAASRRAAADIGRDLGVSPQAAKLIRDSVGADDATMMTANIRTAGSDAMLADAGPTVQGALDAAMQRPGAAARQGMAAIENRAAAVMGQINTTLDDVLGVPQGQETAKTAIRTGTQAARGADYNAAYAVPIDYASDAGMRLEGLAPRIPGKAIKDANLLMQIDGNESRQIMAQVADDGTVAFKQMPDVRQWDYIKRALDLAAQSGDGQGALGGQTPLGRAYKGLGIDIRDTLKEAVPQYGQALDTAADAIGRVQSVEAGYTLLRPGTTREAAKEAMRGMTGPERDAMKQGVRDFIDDSLANVRSVISDPNLDAREARKALGDLTSRASRQKIRMLLGDGADTLFRVLSEAEKALGLRAAVAQNSKTAARLAYGERAKELAAPGVIRNVATARPISAVQRAAENLTGSSPEAVARRADRINAEVVDVFTRVGQQRAINALAAIEMAARRNAPNPLAGRGIENAMGRIGFPALAPAVNALRAAAGF